MNLNLSKLKLFLLAGIACLTVVACQKEDPDDNVDPCAADFQTQTATGSFMSDPFTFVEGVAKIDPFDSTEYRITLYGETVTGDPCDNFNFDVPDRSIIFTLPQQVGTYELSLGTYSVTFNDIVASGQTNADISVCGAVEIVSISNGTLVGKIDADAQNGGSSILNGDFSVQICN